FGVRDDRSRQRFRRNFAALGVDGKAEVAQNFQGIDPGLDDARFVAEQTGFPADGGQKFPRTRAAGDSKLPARHGNIRRLLRVREELSGTCKQRSNTENSQDGVHWRNRGQHGYLQCVAALSMVRNGWSVARFLVATMEG